MVLVMVVLVDIECSFTFRFRFISDRLIIMRFWLKRQRDRVGNYSISPLNIDKSPRYSCSTPVNKFGQFWIATSLLWTDTFTHFCYLLIKSVIISWDAYYAKKYTLTQCKEGARYVIFVLFGNFILQIILTVYRQLVLRMLKLLFQFHPYSALINCAKQLIILNYVILTSRQLHKREILNFKKFSMGNCLIGEKIIENDPSSEQTGGLKLHPQSLDRCPGAPQIKRKKLMLISPSIDDLRTFDSFYMNNLLRRNSWRVQK